MAEKKRVRRGQSREEFLENIGTIEKSLLSRVKIIDIYRKLNSEGKFSGSYASFAAYVHSQFGQSDLVADLEKMENLERNPDGSLKLPEDYGQLRGFAKVQFAICAKEVKELFDNQWPKKFVYQKMLSEGKFTYSYTHFKYLTNKYFGEEFSSVGRAPNSKKFLLHFYNIEEAIKSNCFSREEIIEILTKKNDISKEFPEFCNIFCEALKELGFCTGTDRKSKEINKKVYAQIEKKGTKNTNTIENKSIKTEVTTLPAKQEDNLPDNNKPSIIKKSSLDDEVQINIQDVEVDI